MICTRSMVSAARNTTQFTPAELNEMRITAEFASHPVPELINFYFKYVQRKSNNEHHADWSARFPDPQGMSVEIQACQQGVIVTSSLTYVNGDYSVFVAKTCKGKEIEMYTPSLENIFMFLDCFF